MEQLSRQIKLNFAYLNLNKNQNFIKLKMKKYPPTPSRPKDIGSFSY